MADVALVFLKSKQEGNDYKLKQSISASFPKHQMGKEITEDGKQCKKDCKQKIKGQGKVVQSTVNLTKSLVDDSSRIVFAKSTAVIFFAEKM